MRNLLLAAALLALAATAAATSVLDVTTQTELEEVDPVNRQAQAGLNALKTLLGVYQAAAKIFEVLPGGQVAALAAQAIGFIGALFGFFDKPESAELQFMRQEFTKVHNELANVRLDIKNVKDLISWTSTMRQYSRFEQNIRVCSRKLDSYLRATAAQKAGAQRELVRDCRSSDYITAGEHLYLGIIQGGSTTNNIIRASREFTKQNQPITINFLLDLTRLIMRGAELEITITRLTDKNHADTKRQQWERFIRTLINTLDNTDRDLRREAVWLPQMRRDMDDHISQKHRQSNQNFANAVARELVDKYPFRRWFVLAYKNVGGDDNHQVAVCHGFAKFRVAGNRNVVVASSDPKTSRFNRNRAGQTLRAVNTQVRHRHAKRYTDAISGVVGNDCRQAAGRFAICWGCDVYASYTRNTEVYLRANPTLDAGGRVCRNCHMHLWMFG